MRIFLTGGTGFIGHYVSKALLKRGHSLHIATRHPNKIPSLAKHPNVTLFEASLNDSSILKEAIQNCDACIHIALGWGETPLTMLENDTKATVNLLEMATAAQCKKFLYTSSTAAMGKMRQSMDETIANLPIDLYGATKAAGEAYVLGYRNNNSASPMKRNIIRPGYTFGNPAFADGCTQPDTRFKTIAQNARDGKDILLIKNDGTQFIHAAHQAEVFVKVIESDYDEEIFLSLGSTWISWKEIAERAVALTGSSSKIIEQDLGWGETPMLFSVRKISEYLGCSFDARACIDEHLKYYLDR